ncbi:MAG: aspartate aminotransferase family protein [Gammaproteobacteria bacterium]|nr:aspartate aminotransferase family protein [Gammaproteobacteria bacterium]
MMSHVMETYGRLPVSFVSGSGATLRDEEGKAYFDALCGLAVCGLGHAHPRVAKAVADQAGTLIHTSNLYGVPLQEKLADRLCDLSGMERVFFANSGAEANEAAIKIARLHGHNRDINKPTAIVVDGSFHGRTMATLTATGNRKVRAGFDPLLSGFVRAPFDNLEAIANIAANNPNVVAMMVEPVLGEGGIIIPEATYLEGLRKICDDNEWLLMLDEVQTGNGRTGKFFAYQHTSVTPDVVTTAKGLGNGLPIGACLARGVAASTLKPGNHASTFGGNPLVCAAAHAVLDALTEDGLIERAAELGERIVGGLREVLQGNNQITEVRGKGLMIAVETAEPCSQLVGKALDQGLLVNVTRDNILRLLPPLILSDDEADELVHRVSTLLST